MNVKYLNVACTCGFPARYIHAIGFTSLMELYIQWRCVRCKAQCFTTKPLEECVANCPAGDETRFTVRDLAYLSELKITMPS